MAADTIKKSRMASKARAKESWEFRLIYLVGFTVFLVAALIERLLPRSWRGHPDDARASKSILVEAKEAAQTSIPYAFMG